MLWLDAAWYGIKLLARRFIRWAKGLINRPKE